MDLPDLLIFESGLPCKSLKKCITLRVSFRDDERS